MCAAWPTVLNIERVEAAPHTSLTANAADEEKWLLTAAQHLRITA